MPAAFCASRRGYSPRPASPWTLISTPIWPSSTTPSQPTSARARCSGSRRASPRWPRLVLAWRRWPSDLLAWSVAAGGLALLLIYRYVDIGAWGPFPSMYEPIWYGEKVAAVVAQAVTVVATLYLLLLRPRPRPPPC
ncbi:hypothetical protein NKH18_35350 [Streptomyces sp. M10(2022)]